MDIKIFFALTLFFGHGICLPCPPGWVPFGFSCYMVSSYQMNWHDAQKYCNSHQGYLLEIGSEEEQQFVDILMSTDTTTGSYWLNLSDMTEEGNWIWQNSFLEPSYTNWYHENPHIDVESNCAQIKHQDMDPNGLNWYDISCDVDKDPSVGWGIHAICETKL